MNGAVERLPQLCEDGRNGLNGRDGSEFLMAQVLSILFAVFALGCAMTHDPKAITQLPDSPEVTKGKVLVASVVWWANNMRDAPLLARFVDDELFAAPEVQSLKKSLRVFRKSDRIGRPGFFLSQDGLELTFNSVEIGADVASVGVSSSARGFWVAQDYILSRDRQGNWKVTGSKIVGAS
jgi:hypothetical protein